MSEYDIIQRKLNEIKNMGFIETLRSGNTGVGHTLETLHGIKENNNSGPDFRGKELKATRDGCNSKISNFTLAPIWEKPIREIISSYGKWDEEKQRYNFFPSLTCGSVNSTGQTLKIDNKNVYAFCERTQTILAEWCLAALDFHQKRKLRKLILVKANARGRGKKEQFHYHTAHYYGSLKPDAFRGLLEGGKIVLEPRVWYDPKSGKIRDRGSAFRITANLIDELYDQKEKIL